MTGYHRTADPDHPVLVSCWCETDYRYVPWSWVHDGYAPECGPACWSTYAARVTAQGRTPTPAHDDTDTVTAPRPRWRG